MSSARKRPRFSTVSLPPTNLCSHRSRIRRQQRVVDYIAYGQRCLTRWWGRLAAQQFDVVHSAHAWGDGIDETAISTVRDPRIDVECIRIGDSCRAPPSESAGLRKHDGASANRVAEADDREAVSDTLRCVFADEQYGRPDSFAELVLKPLEKLVERWIALSSAPKPIVPAVHHRDVRRFDRFVDREAGHRPQKGPRCFSHSLGIPQSGP